MTGHLHTRSTSAFRSPYRDEAAQLQHEWESLERWTGIERRYDAESVVRLRGSVRIDHTIARLGAERLWQLLRRRDRVMGVGALSGAQAVQMVRAGLPVVYVSGWQVAADANGAGQTYPDQSLYPSNSAPALVRRISNALRRADQIDWSEGDVATDWNVPIVADAESGFGGPVNAFETMKSMVEAGAAGIHFEDQLGTEKRYGPDGGKVLMPPSHFIRTLSAARLAADVMAVPSLLIARTDALSATLLCSDVDDREHRATSTDRTPEGYFRVKPGIDAALERALLYAPYADVLWYVTSGADLDGARRFAEGVHARYPGKPLAYNLAAEFDWHVHFDEKGIEHFQEELTKLGYCFQFLTVGGYRVLSSSMFDVAAHFSKDGMAAYAALRERERALLPQGYTAHAYHREVGTSYFDLVASVVAGASAAAD